MCMKNWCCLLCSAIFLFGVWNSGALAEMSVKDFHERCVMDVKDECRGMCDQFQEGMTVDVNSKEQCREKCNALSKQLGAADAVSNCEGSVGTATDLCLEYCESNS